MSHLLSAQKISYHNCTFCRSMVIDLKPRHSTILEKPPDHVILFELKLDQLVAAASTCQLSQWLIASWKTSPYCDWDDLKARGCEISLAMSYLSYSFEPLPVVEIAWVGLWDPKQVFDEQDGRCRVVSQGYLDVFTTADDPAANCMSTRPINPTIGSQENFVLARRWLQDCVNAHRGCPKPTTNFIPRTVLKVSQGVESQYHARLHYPAKVEPYTALSYCWGGDQPHKTTKERISSESFELDWNLLPASIQDAIKVTVGLGYEYLWVDSLCIVQDDDQEKAKQIALMPDIYANAVTTIVASRANRAVDGFLHDVDIGSVSEWIVKLPFRCPDSSAMGSAYVVKMRNSGASEPIDYRGWTFQERYLSPRVLDYTSNQLLWICPTAGENEGYSDGWKAGSRQDDAGLYPVSSFYERHSTSRSSNGQRDALTEWRSIVMIYTRRTLTFPKDRILAISGVANRYQALFQDQYLAGHWRETLPYDLLWSVRSGKLIERRPTVYLAPSWSWASITNEIWFNLASATSPSELPPPSPVISLDEIQTDLEEASAIFGAVTNGCIRGSGKIRTVSWYGNQATPDGLHVLHDVDPEGNVEPIPLLRMIPDAIEPEFSGASTVKDEALSVHCLHVGTCIGAGLVGHAGLVLRELGAVGGAPSRRRFSRLGVFHINPSLKRRKQFLGVARPSDTLARGNGQDFFCSAAVEDFEIL